VLDELGLEAEAGDHLPPDENENESDENEQEDHGDPGVGSDFDEGDVLDEAFFIGPVMENTAGLAADGGDIDISNMEDGGQDSMNYEAAEEDDDLADAHHRVPSIARWRLNLTALSQRYNLYIVAYRNQIHISRPRSCISHCLPSTPDLVLTPGASPMSFQVGGTLDEDFPHQVNHLMVGDFGEEEILLMAYDDGDIIAYYTRHIEEAVQDKLDFVAQQCPRSIQPFFHENVEKSAWGLAIHKKSRLIAVGSNLHAATVFIPALTGAPFRHVPGIESRDLYWKIVKNCRGGVEDMRTRFPDGFLEHLLRQRDTNWKIVLQTGPHGDNIPNLTFSDDEEGNAEKVVAIDVAGKVWMMDIWTFNESFVAIPPLHRGPPHSRPGDHGRRVASYALPETTGIANLFNRPRGWGVVVLHDSSFLPTMDFQDSLGVTRQESRLACHPDVGRWIDTSRGASHIPQSSTQHPWARARRPRRGLPDGHQRLVEREYWFEDYTDRRSPTWQQQVLFGGGPRGDSNYSASQRPWESDSPDCMLADGSSILRLYETDIELMSQEVNGVGIMMQHVTKQVQPQPQGIPALRWAHERLSNYHYVPELSLVIAGSMCGRVALITLTRPAASLSFKRGFKVEAILPTEKDEDDRLRPVCPLFGVSVGPLPLASNSQPDKFNPARPRRYRVMLQYYDLRILSYEISRGTPSDNLTVA
jgi:hypothetical protein